MIARSYRRMGLAAGSVLLALVTSVGAAKIDKGPYLQQVDTTGVTVCWVTDIDAPSSVEYGTTARLGRSVAEQLTSRERGELVWSAGGPGELRAFHRVRLTGLAPDARYYYRVRTGDLASDVASFQAAVRPGQRFTFVAFGDVRPTPAHRTVISRIMALDPQPRFAVFTGDLLSNGQRWPDWQGFFDWEEPMLRQIPFYPALGNHEHDAENYLILFSGAEDQRWYSFDYGDAHVVVLDSNGPYRSSPAQRAWLVQDLATNWDKPYAFVVFHHPLYTCTNDLGRRMGALDLVRDWGPIFEAYGITAVLNGHDHNYQHNVVNGIHYVVAGGGGASLYPVRPQAFTAKAAEAYDIVEIAIDGPQATFTTTNTEDGSIIETFSVPRRDTRPLR